MTKKQLKNNIIFDCFMKPSENNIILDCFIEPSENLKNFIIKYELKNLSKVIMKEKKDSEYLLCSALSHKIDDKEFFYGNKNEVKDKITSYLLKLNKYYSRSFFCVYDFVNDCEVQKPF